MIAWLRGRVLHVEGNDIVINVGNIGYDVHIGENRLLRLSLKKDQELELVIGTVVREDEIKLFGFDTFVERQLFHLLLSVSGIGPKAAISIVDSLEPKQIVQAIQIGDFQPFLRINGIGKKTAQRLVLDLQGKLSSVLTPPLEENPPPGTAVDRPEEHPVSDYILLKDATSALSNLGFTEREAEKAIRPYLHSGLNLDEIIRKSLADLKQ